MVSERRNARVLVERKYGCYQLAFATLSLTDLFMKSSYCYFLDELISASNIPSKLDSMNDPKNQ